MLKKSLYTALTLLLVLNVRPGLSNAEEADGKATYYNRADNDGKSLAETALDKRDGTTRIYIDDNDRDYIRDYLDRDYRDRGTRLDPCPSDMREYRDRCVPLSNKDNDQEAKNDDYSVGTTLSKDVNTEPVSRDLKEHLKPVPDDYEYVRVNNDILLISKENKKVIDSVTVNKEQ